MKLKFFRILRDENPKKSIFWNFFRKFWKWRNFRNCRKSSFLKMLKIKLVEISKKICHFLERFLKFFIQKKFRNFRQLYFQHFRKWTENFLKSKSRKSSFLKILKIKLVEIFEKICHFLERFLKFFMQKKFRNFRQLYFQHFQKWTFDPKSEKFEIIKMGNIVNIDFWEENIVKIDFWEENIVKIDFWEENIVKIDLPKLRFCRDHNSVSRALNRSKLVRMELWHFGDIRHNFFIFWFCPILAKTPKNGVKNHLLFDISLTKHAREL